MVLPTRASWSGRCGRAIAAGIVAAIAAGCVDAAAAWLRGGVAPRYLIVALGLHVAFGAPVGAGLIAMAAGLRRGWCSSWTSRADATAWVASAALVSLGLAGLAYAAGLASLERHTSAAALRRLTWIIGFGGAMALALATVVGSLVRGRPRRVALVGVLALVGAGGAVVHIATHPGTVDLRWVVVGAVFGSILPLGWVVPARFVRPILAAGLGLGLGGVVVLVRDPAMRLIAARYAPASGPGVRLLGRLVDVDRDGFSSLSGLGDCAPLAADIHPLAAEIPGDGIDQDCHAGDLDPAVLRVDAPEPPAAVPDSTRPHLLLITVDTLRADHLGLYGYERPTSPNIDAFFAKGRVFDRAYTVSPVTDRSLPSLLGGHYPTTFTEALDYRTHVVSDARVLLTELLRPAEYFTVTLQSFQLFGKHGLQQGFDEWRLHGNAELQDAERTTDAALGVIAMHARRRPDRPLFLWVHYYEPHSRYEPPARHRLWDGGGDYRDEEPMDLYDAEIHYVDAEIGRLLDSLTTRGWIDRTLVVLASDHGEEFFEHGATGHAKALYEESIRIPWAIAGPGVVAGRVPEPVSIVDMMPTLAELVNVPHPTAIAGRSQAAAVRGGAAQSRAIFAEQFQHGTDHVQTIAIIDGDHKLILDLDDQLWELYDLRADPGERTNLATRAPELADALQGPLLDHWSVAAAARATEAR